MTIYFPYGLVAIGMSMYIFLQVPQKKKGGIGRPRGGIENYPADVAREHPWESDLFD